MMFCVFSNLGQFERDSSEPHDLPVYITTGRIYIWGMFNLDLSDRGFFQFNNGYSKVRVLFA